MKLNLKKEIATVNDTAGRQGWCCGTTTGGCSARTSSAAARPHQQTDPLAHDDNLLFGLHVGRRRSMV